MSAIADSIYATLAAPWAGAIFVLLIAIVVALAVHGILFAALRRIAIRSEKTLDNAAVRYARAPTRLLLALLAWLIVLPGLEVGDDARVILLRLSTIGLTAAVGWLAFSLSRLINDYVAQRYDIGAADNLRAREVHTRVRLLQRILAATILIVTGCLILMAIPSVRQIGITLFASAGIAGIVGGLAARPALSNLIAGLQLALSQPIRIDDVVIIEGEWGRVEEIRTTFVVVRIWDMRRLVVPLTYFIETPFQNWTRTTADILGTVYLYMDYAVPVAAVREELHRLLQQSDLWDGEIWGLQVTGTTDRTVELRALMGARNSGDAWNLRCHVREQLIVFLQEKYPHSLPRVRAELETRPGDPMATHPV